MDRFEIAVVKELLVSKPLHFYCILTQKSRLDMVSNKLLGVYMYINYIWPEAVALKD